MGGYLRLLNARALVIVIMRFLQRGFPSITTMRPGSRKLLQAALQSFEAPMYQSFVSRLKISGCCYVLPVIIHDDELLCTSVCAVIKTVEPT